MKQNLAALGLAVILLMGCATGLTTRLSEAKAEGPRVIALDAPRTPWVVEIERRLREAGFQVLRRPSIRTVKEQTSTERTEIFREASTRYVLTIDGRAPLDFMNRCIGGGFKFDYLSVDVVDTVTNETLVNVSGSGYSEGCAPASGTIFRDITDAVASLWQK